MLWYRSYRKARAKPARGGLAWQVLQLKELKPQIEQLQRQLERTLRAQQDEFEAWRVAELARAKARGRLFGEIGCFGIDGQTRAHHLWMVRGSCCFGSRRGQSGFWGKGGLFCGKF